MRLFGKSDDGSHERELRTRIAVKAREDLASRFPSARKVFYRDEQTTALAVFEVTAVERCGKGTDSSEGRFPVDIVRFHTFERGRPDFFVEVLPDICRLNPGNAVVCDVRGEFTVTSFEALDIDQSFRPCYVTREQARDRVVGEPKDEERTE